MATNFTGALSGDWSDPGNWSAGVPTAADDAVLLTNVMGDPTLSADAQCKTLSASAPMALHLAGFELTISGDFDASTLTSIEGLGVLRFNANALFTAAAGVPTLPASVIVDTCTLTLGTDFFNDHFKDLTFSGNGGIDLQGFDIALLGDMNQVGGTLPRQVIALGGNTIGCQAFVGAWDFSPVAAAVNLAVNTYSTVYSGTIFKDVDATLSSFPIYAANASDAGGNVNLDFNATTWQGFTDDAWDDPLNWSAGVPGPSTVVNLAGGVLGAVLAADRQVGSIDAAVTGQGALGPSLAGFSLRVNGGAVTSAALGIMTGPGVLVLDAALLQGVSAAAVNVDLRIIGTVDATGVNIGGTWCDDITLNAGATLVLGATGQIGNANTLTGGAAASLDLTGVGPGATVTLDNDLTWAGDMLSDVPWQLAVAGSSLVTAGLIQQSDATGSAAPIVASGATDGGGNVNWDFGGADPGAMSRLLLSN